jgi:iron complex outermembrane recepter protein
MKKLLLLSFIAITGIYQGFAQKGLISGTVTDAVSGESIIGVNIVYGKGVGVVTDLNGKYSAQLPYGEYTLTVSYVGYIAQNEKVTVGAKPVKLDFQLKIVTLSEILVVGDVARQRETPVAFSTITPMKVQEQLAGRDIPMLLNSTPGVYASQDGGGDGDARVTIRGFTARNIGVLLDGVPVNDMENGWVYWSNWFGLDAVTRSLQVQRGLGASKLALPSAGGTINIITKGIDERKGGILKQELGSEGYLNTSFGYNSGKMQNGFGFTLAGSYKTGDGWVDHAWSKAYFLYVKVDKSIGNHIISLAAYGAPQSHAQRLYNLPAAVYNKQWAMDHGVDSSDLAGYKPSAWKDSKYTYDHGVRFNQHWGQYETYTINNYGKYDLEGHSLADTVNRGSYNDKNERVNEFFKPQFTLKDFWTVNNKLAISNIAYMSIGRGGGIRAKNNMTVMPNGEMDFQTLRDYNSFRAITKSDSMFYSSTLRRTDGNFLVERKNEHQWIGFLSTVNYKYSSSITMSGGVDLRTYKGVHYEEIYDLMGADYISNADDHSYSYLNPDGTFNFKKAMRFEGDKIYYYNDGILRWGGLFYQAEYKKDQLTAFINVTGARTGYKRVDHFKPDSLQTTDWKWINGWTIKGGANYNITKHLSAFINLGYLNKAPRFNNVYDNTNLLYRDIRNEKVKAMEAGISYGSPKFSLKINSYYTFWLNRPVDVAPTISITEMIPDPNNPDSLIAGQTKIYQANINGLAALHKGIEVDFAYNITKKVNVQGICSFGDWKWNSADSVRIRDDYGETVKTLYVNAKGLHVGNAAQFQLGGEIRYEPIRDLYISGGITYFDKYYADFDPLSYEQSNPVNKPNFDEGGNPVDPWKIPAYYLVDFHAGYNIKFYKQYKLQFRANLINAFDKIYVSDAVDNSRNIGQSWNTHDTRSAAVYFGLGRRYTVSMAIQF